MGGTEGGLGSTGVWGVPTIYIYIYIILLYIYIREGRVVAPGNLRWVFWGSIRNFSDDFFPGYPDKCRGLFQHRKTFTPDMGVSLWSTKIGEQH